MAWQFLFAKVRRAANVAAMSFWTPNIDLRGRIIRGCMTLVLFGAALFAEREGGLWLAVLLVIAGLVGLVETVRGWCLLRACKIKTRF